MLRYSQSQESFSAPKNLTSMRRLGIVPFEVRSRKLFLALVTATAIVGISIVIAVVWQAPDKYSTITYTGTGTSSAQRVEVNLQASAIDNQLAPDAILPIYQPASMFIPWNESNINDQSYVMGLAINGEAKAYPVEVLNFREMVNDVVGGVPVLVTW